MTRNRPSLRRPVHSRVAHPEQRPERIRKPGHIAEVIARHAAVLVTLLVIALAALVRLRLTDVPLERDEGEYAYAGQLILKGVPPYLEAYNMKFPGTYYAYALIMALFGQTARGIHVGLMLVNAGAALIVFAIARRLADDLCAAVAATAFLILSLDRWILGIFAHATHFVLLPALGGLLLLLVARESERLWPSLAGGTLLGMAVLMKQHALVFVPLGVGLVAWPTTGKSRASWTRSAMKDALVCIGTTLPLGIVAVMLYRQGVLDRFWLWAVRYAKEYVSEVPLSFAWTVLSDKFTKVTHSTLVLWLVAAVGLVALALDRWPPLTRFFVFGLLATSFLGICPGFYFREHYFILLLPAIALLVGITAVSVRRLLSRRFSPVVSLNVTIAVLTALAALFVVRERSYLFSMTPRELIRSRYGTNPFIEASEIARYIKERTGEQERIVVVGSEPEIYFYADRRSASGYIYTYALMEPQAYATRMQDEMIREIDGAHPKFLVIVDVYASWLARPESSRKIIEWAKQYVRECYELVGVADIVSRSETRLAWGDGVREYRPTSHDVVYTYRRTSEAPCSVAW